MKTMAQVQSKPASTPSFTPVRTRLLQRRCACGDTPGPDGECAGCRKKRLALQRRSTDHTRPSTAPPIVNEVLRSPGQPLDDATRAFMEPRFGHNFGRVRVHVDAKAAESARAVNALAYTVGQDIVFEAGRYAPGASEGRKLLAHELTHVVQQENATSTPGGAPLPLGEARDRWEGEAERKGDGTTRSSPNEGGISPTPACRVQRRDPDAPFPSSPPGPPASTAKTYNFSVSTYGCHEAPYVRATVVAAARAAFDKVSSSNCVHSESLKDDILSEFDGLSIDCEQGDDSDPCGMASRYFTQTVNIYPKALDFGRCGPLESTILHEVVHLTEWALFGHGELADACEASCFGYGSGDPAKCK